VKIVQLGYQDYSSVWLAMRRYTDERNEASADQLWFVEHPPVFTLGQASRPEHLLDVGEIPVVQSDRGGQVTYHGPGQLIMYVMLDLRRRKLGVRALVTHLELAVIELLKALNIESRIRQGAPGVYVGKAKVASLGLRVRQGCSYHGLALNVDMDLEPFKRINPCGYPGLAVTRLADLGVTASRQELAFQLCALFTERLKPH
jgi:lipoyl(octanoyl) transferase